MLVHDAQFVAGERARAVDFGHAVVDDVVTLAEEAGVARLVLFHHDPGRVDDDVESITKEAAAAAAVPVTCAVEGMTLDV